MPTTKTPKTTHSPAPKAPRKPRATAVKKAPVKHKPKEHVKPDVATESLETPVSAAKPKMDAGRYIFATGRRKTAVANIRLFSGGGSSVVNKKPAEKYFSYAFFQDTVHQPFQVTGLGKDYYFVATVNGGGAHAQAQAVRHGISIALSKISDEIRKVLKKNGFLTRDDRKKERKKPGLKRARRSPQWAKR